MTYNPGVSAGTSEMINAATRYCAIFGHPIAHSASPCMHNAAFAAQGLNWRYLAFEVHPNRLGEALSGAKSMKFMGLNLTVPHKLLAVEMMDELDESARAWGAVNTVRFEARDAEGNWKPLIQFAGAIPEEIRAHGFNTDVDGLARSLKEDLDFTAAGKRIVVLGAGGAGSAAAMKLASEGAGELQLVNRTASKAEALAVEISRRWPAVKAGVGYPAGEVDLVINATSLGLKCDDPLPFDGRLFALERARMVYDMIYRPAETAFLKEALARGCRAVNGLGMLLHQGTLAFEIWTGKPAPAEVMKVALKENIYGH